MRGPLIVLVLLGTALAAGCAGSGPETSSSSSGAPDASTSATSAATADSSTATTSAATTPAVSTPSRPFKPGPDGCDHRPPVNPPIDAKLDGPPALPGDVMPATVVMETSCGIIRIRLDEANGGVAAQSFAGLAASGFYDGISFHRVVPEFVVQGGDPTGLGAGGPGYSVVQAPPRDYVYQVGDVAMAKTIQESAGTAGSQFFIVSSGKAPQLLSSPGQQPLYAVVGHLADDESLATVKTIDLLAPPTPEGGAPIEPVYILRASVEG